MNFSISKINNLFSKNREKNIVYTKKYLSPQNDWFKIVISFSLIFFLVVSFSVYYYYQISSGNFFRNKEIEDIPNKSTVIKQDLMTRVVNDIESRKSVREKSNIFIPKDPSI